MKYNEFLKLIGSDSLSGAYLLHGEEEYIKESAVSAAEGLIPEDLRAFNYSVLYEPDLQKIIDTCETLPVFSDKTLVIAKETSNSLDSSALISYIENMSPLTVLLIVKKGKLDERTALVKYFIKQGRDVVFYRLDERETIKWCMQSANKQGVFLDQSAARIFVGIVGLDMSTVSNELQKAIDRVGPGGTITAEVISSTVVGTVESKVFSMLDCFTAGKVKDGMRALRVLLSERSEAPIKIISFLESRFKLMLQGKLLMADGLSPKNAAQKIEGNAYANEMAFRAAAKYSTESLKKLVKDVSLVMYNSINGLCDPVEAIETIMASFDWTGERGKRTN